MAGQPVTDGGGLVGGEVVADLVDVQVSGSEDSLNESLRCGLRSNLRQIRPIVDGDSPLRAAIEDRDQWVASFGVSSSVAVMTRST